MYRTLHAQTECQGTVSSLKKKLEFPKSRLNKKKTGGNLVLKKSPEKETGAGMESVFLNKN